MRLLIISLDKKILDFTSSVAERMRQYGASQEICILIPDKEKQSLQLSSTVHVETTGGGKIAQFFRLVTKGKALIAKEQIERITTQDPFFTGLVGSLLKAASGVSFEVQVHGDFYRSSYYRNQGFKNRVQLWIGKRVLRYADHIRVVGQRIQQSLLALGIPKEKIELQPIQIDREYIQHYQAKWDIHTRYTEYEKIFVWLGRLDPVKNLDWLIHLFKEIVTQKPRWGLLIIGEGAEQKKLTERVEQLGLGRQVRFETWTDDPLSFLKTADALLFPSLSEGYGMVVMEALAAGCPVIMNDVGVAGFEARESKDLHILSVREPKKWLEILLSV